MNKLELSKGITPDDIVRYYFEEMDTEEIGDFLWRETSYPFGGENGIEILAEEVWEYYLKNRN